MVSQNPIQDEFRILTKTFEKPDEGLSESHEIAWLLSIIEHDMEELHVEVGGRIYRSSKSEIDDAYNGALDMMIEEMEVEEMVSWNDLCHEITQFSLVDAVRRGIEENEHWRRALLSGILAIYMRDIVMPHHFNILTAPIRSLNVPLVRVRSL